MADQHHKNKVTQGRHIRVTHFDDDEHDPLTVVETLRTDQEPLVLAADDAAELLSLLKLLDQLDDEAPDEFLQ